MKVVIEWNKKDFDGRRDLKSKIEINGKCFYKCLNLTAWFRYENNLIRIERLLHFLNGPEEVSDLDVNMKNIIKLLKDKDIDKTLKEYSEYFDDKFNEYKYSFPEYVIENNLKTWEDVINSQK